MDFRRSNRPALLAMAVWVLLAGPARAIVEDPMSVLDATLDAALDTGMKNINASQIVVLLLRTVPSDTPTASAISRFVARPLSSSMLRMC